MKIYILNTNNEELAEGEIVSAQSNDMKTITDGWEFNWRKHYSLPNSKAFKVTTKANPDIVEGLMIFQILDGIPYMAYLESAPHNKGQEKRFDYVAGCLIAKACQLSFTETQDPRYLGYLSFQCMTEELIKLYHHKYEAIRVDKTYMYIEPSKGNELIETYLLRKI